MVGGGNYTRQCRRGCVYPSIGRASSLFSPALSVSVGALQLQPHITYGSLILQPCRSLFILSGFPVLYVSFFCLSRRLPPLIHSQILLCSCPAMLLAWLIFGDDPALLCLPRSPGLMHAVDSGRCRPVVKKSWLCYSRGGPTLRLVHCSNYDVSSVAVHSIGVDMRHFLLWFDM